MDNEKLNKRLAGLADRDDLYEAFGGKAIPFVGWFWREVDFNASNGYSFGIIPPGMDGNSKPLVGFMESNKWDYPYVEASAEQWADIKAKIVALAEAPEPTRELFEAVDQAIQALAEGMDFRSSWLRQMYGEGEA